MATEALTTTISSDLKERVLSEFWAVKNNQAESKKEKQLAAIYYEHYSKQVHLMLYNGGQTTPTWTHNDVVDVMTYIRDSHDREGILSKFQFRFAADSTTTSEDIVDRLIDLSARLCLMTSFGKARFADERQISLEWAKGSAKEALHHHFTPQQVLGVEPKFKLPKIFTARNVHHIGGIQIEWTPYLSEHLQLLDHDERVAIFPHVGFLNIHRKSDLFPPGFIDETIRTLALLFPRNDKDTKRWIQSLSDVDFSIRKCGQLGADGRKIENFTFWRDRLVMLKEVFDEAEPRNLWQLWFDNRKRVQWYTFWVAVLVFVLAMFFGLVQSIEGALQVYIAFRNAN